MIDGLVSVIVPIYGVEQYLRRCVDSLLSQSHAELEIILVDDGSPDDCGDICDEYASRDSRVRVFHQENAGQSAARNAALEVSTGEFLTFVDPDDWAHKEMISWLLLLLREADADIAACHALRTGTSEVGSVSTPGDVKVLSAKDALKLYGGPQASLMNAPWAKLYRASLFEDVRFPVGRLYEDVFTTYRVMSRARRVVLASGELYYYFIRPGSTTQQSQDHHLLLDFAAGLLEQEEYFRSHGLTEVSGVNLRKVFLIQRRVRREIARSGDAGLLDSVQEQTHTVAKHLWLTNQPLYLRVFAAAYSQFPRLLDALLDVYRWFGSKMDEAGHRSHISSEARQPASSDPGIDHFRGLEVIVVAYGSPEMLRSTLQPVRSLPVTVVDNSSLPAIRNLCAELGCHYIDPGRNGGFAAGVNVGLANLENPKSDVLLLNPDAVITVEGVKRLHAALLADDGLASVGPRQVDGSGAPIRVAWPFPSPLGTWLDAVGMSKLRPRTEYVSGAILLLRSEAIADVGPFDDRFFLYAEEADWQYRARLSGWRNQVIDSVTAMHAGGATSSDERKRQTHFHASHERFLRKHHGVLGWQVARLGQLAGDLVRAAVRRGDRRASHLSRAGLYVRGPLRTEIRQDSSVQPRRIPRIELLPKRANPRARRRNQFSVIIPTMLKSRHLESLLSTYCSHDRVVEVLVINNTDIPLDFPHPKFRELRQDRNIFVNPSWNLGAAEARGDRLIISNDDIWFNPRLIDAVDRFMNMRRVGIVGPALSSMNSKRDGRPIFLPAYRLPHGFGTLMFLRKADYTPIPADLLINAGDNWLFDRQRHRNFQFVGAQVGTQWSLTSGLPEFSEARSIDSERFRAAYQTDTYLNRYRLEYAMQRAVQALAKRVRRLLRRSNAEGAHR